jgi:predicted metal-dependent hydrolase
MDSASDSAKAGQQPAEAQRLPEAAAVDLPDLDWRVGALADGLRCYRCGDFFEAHEYWELVWLQCAEPEKTFLQSLIQVSAAFHHLSRGNRVGARSLLTRALRRLERYPDQFGGVGVAELRQRLREWLLALEAGSGLPAYPRIAACD